MTAIRYFCKADPIGDRAPKDTVIHISNELPKFPNLDTWQQDYDRFYTEQANQLAEALCNALPSGTRLRLVKALFNYEITNNGYFRGL